MTIQALCRKDPEKAFEITGRFGIYLRQNIDSLEHIELVPLEKELEHTGNMNVQSNRQHIGIRNVRERIEKMCGGILTVESRVGEGTAVTTHILNI